MLSMARVGSAGGSAKYFAADNYYTDAQATAASEWVGKGAALAGLSGAPTQESLRDILEGKMPDGTQLPVGRNGKRAFGSDFTFSAPKSISILALIGGDKRLVQAHQEAVREAMAFGEENLAYARVQNPDGSMSRVKTNNLVYGLFLHDTNREQEPQLHTHAVFANATQTPDGKWRALYNQPMWKANTLLNSIYTSVLRNKVMEFGFQYDITGKHGQFDLKGFTRELIMAFSTRREQILAEIGVRRVTHEQQNAIVLRTREDKVEVEDREALYASWREKAESLGADVDGKVADSYAVGDQHKPAWARAVEGMLTVRDRIRAITAHFAERLGMTKNDPLSPRHGLAASPADMATAQVVASAIRHLSEREAGFRVHAVYQTALNFDLPNVTIQRVQARVDELVKEGVLVRGTGINAEMITTAEAIRVEKQIMAEAEAGRGKRTPLMSAALAGERVQAVSLEKYNIRLNPGQESAARQMLSTRDRMFAIQGVAGAGKTTVLKPVDEVLKEHGKQLMVLSTDHETVGRFREDGLEGRTIASFLGSYARLLEPSAAPDRIAAARLKLQNTLLVVDESSKTSNLDQLKLNRLMNLLDVQMNVMGDERQQGAVAAGKPFEEMQRLGLETVQMPENLRAISPLARRLVFHLYDGRPDRAMTALTPYIIIAPDSIAQTGADSWLKLDGETREKTRIYTDGRVLKNQANAAVQAGLLKEGALGAKSITLEVLDPENSTMEEARFTATYRQGQVVVLNKQLRRETMNPGEYAVVDVDGKSGTVTVRSEQTGRVKTFKPKSVKQEPGQMPTLELHRKRDLTLHERDKVRFGSNDEKRGIHNADRGTVLAIDKEGITIELKGGAKVTLKPGDPLLRRIDLAYALHVYKTQGASDTNAIALLDSRNDKLATEKALLTIGTRIRESLVAVMDNSSRYLKLVESQPGHKVGALEINGELPYRAPSRAIVPGMGPSSTTNSPSSAPTAPSAGGKLPGAGTSNDWDKKAAAAFEKTGTADWGKAAAQAMEGLEAAKSTIAAAGSKEDTSASGKQTEAEKPKAAIDEAASASTKPETTPAATPKPELEKKIDDGGGSRTRQIEFDL